MDIEPLVLVPAGLERLPLHVRPAPSEALVSWSWRLAARFGWNLSALAREGLGLSEPLRPDWWARPEDSLLATLQVRTGVEWGELRRMTLLDWAPVVRDDEASGRFAGWRFEALPPDERERGLAVCTDCLRADTSPYLRQSWLIGWTAVCQVHGSVLLTRCPECRRPLRTPKPGSPAKFQASRCVRCCADLTQAGGDAAPAEISQLHDVLLTGKRTGKTVLPRIGELDWPELMTLCDVLLGAVWEEMDVTDRVALLGQVTGDGRPYGMIGVDCSRDRVGSLTLLAWLLNDWPHNVESSQVGRIVRRWLREETRRVPTRIGPSFDALRGSRVPDILGAAMS